MNFLISTIAVAGVAALGTVMALQPDLDIGADAAPAKQELRTGKVVKSPGKASAAISMTHQLIGDVAVGEPLTLELLFTARQLQNMQVEIHADDALSVTKRQVTGITKDKPITVNLLPVSEGRFYVRIFARNQNGQARVFAVPVQVGKGPAKSAAHKASRTANGELLIRMPAQ